MKKTVINVVIALCFAVVSTAYAAEEVKPDFDKESLLKCQSEENSESRLACYDKALPPKSQEAKESDSLGKWKVSTKLSPVDDSENIHLILYANESFTSRLGQPVIPAMFITCREKRTELFINWDTFIGASETQLLYRLDKTKAQTKSWDISSDSKAVFYPGNVVEFVKTLSKANSMYVQVTPYGENPVSVTFDLAGLPEALKPLQKACGWK